jgi:hypothetical protein
MYRSEGRLYLGSDKDGVLCGYPSLEDAVSSVEKQYEERHKRSYESSMSTCIFWIFYSPKVVQVASLDDIRDRVIDMKKAAVHTCRNVSGAITGVLCTGPHAAELYNSGIESRLTTR